MTEPIRPLQNEDPLKLLHRCGGYYECPKDSKGMRLGPLVGYAGRDGQGRQKVGEVYANFAKAERHGTVLSQVALGLKDKLPEYGAGFCGAPEGGKALAVTLASLTFRQYIFPEKEILELKTDTSREKSRLVFARHEPFSGEKWWITEDVCNNFSTTREMVDLIESKGATVLRVVCFLNRSLTVDTTYSAREGLELPVIALVRKPIDEWEQDDPAVIQDVQEKNVVWKPKNEWDRLMKAMG